MLSNDLKDRITHEIKSRPKSIGEILEMLSNDKLLLKPFFQRKLVWRKEHKIEFIKTILYNYPFPEVYFSDATNESKQLGKTKWVIDGQQRINAIQEYYNEEGDFKTKVAIPKYSELSPKEQKLFLDYEVSIRELGEMTDEMVRLIFTRINMTEYNLNPMEKLNATYSTTPLFLFARQCIDINFSFDDYFKDAFKEDELDLESKAFFTRFFKKYSVFTSNDERRMADVQYFILLILTIDKGYTHRSTEMVSAFEDNRYTTLKLQNEILSTLKRIFEYIDTLNIKDKKFWTTKVNMFTLVVELSQLKEFERLNNDKVIEILGDLDRKYLLYKENPATKDISIEERNYFNYSLQGINDKANRVYRGDFLKELLLTCLF